MMHYASLSITLWSYNILHAISIGSVNSCRSISASWRMLYSTYAYMLVNSHQALRP